MQWKSSFFNINQRMKPCTIAYSLNLFNKNFNAHLSKLNNALPLIQVKRFSSELGSFLQMLPFNLTALNVSI